ncbi:MAG: carboxypeptidase-like regulatory domain-containing protein [Acidobacteriota bacterium]
MVLSSARSSFFFSLGRLWVAGLLLAGLASPLMAEAPGRVSLPLEDYRRLVTEAEEADAERSRRLLEKPRTSLDWTEQRLRVEVLEKEAEISMELGVKVLGRPEQPRKLPLSGFLSEVSVTGTGGSRTEDLVVLLGESGWQVVATSPGEYRLRIEGRLQIHSQRGGGHLLTLPVIEAPVAGVEVRLPEGVRCEVSEAVVMASRTEDGRRVLELAVEPGSRPKLRLLPRVDSTAAERLSAQVVRAVVVQLRPERWRRHDVMLYEVARGSLDRFELGLPPGLELEEASTDEGPLPAAVAEGAVTLHRSSKLEGTGYAVVSSGLDADSRAVDLESLRTDLEVRAAYLVVAGSLAAEVAPLSPESWSRVDLEDLPEALGEALESVDLVAAWRLRPGQAAGSLGVEPFEEASAAASVIQRRDTTTLMTVDGTLLHRDVLTLSSAGSVLEVELPAGASLWSVQVAEQGVRPLKSKGLLRIPLALAGFGEETSVEIVSVSERALPAGRSMQSFELPRLKAPVLDHRWRVLLPETARYRVRESTLGVESAASLDLQQPVTAGRLARGTHLMGVVRGEDGLALPGVVVTLELLGGSLRREAITGRTGRFVFSDLELPRSVWASGGSRVRLRAELDGFSEAQTELSIRPDQIHEQNLSLTVAGEYAIVVTSELPSVLAISEISGSVVDEINDFLRDESELRLENEYQLGLATLRQGIAGGVKPVPVTLPETGKSLRLVGLLPPASVSLSLDVRAPRR